MTNEQYLKSVEDGGYQSREYWMFPFLDKGQETREPLDRDPSFGFRCVSYSGNRAPAIATVDIDEPTRDDASESIADDNALRWPKWTLNGGLLH